MTIFPREDSHVPFSRNYLVASKTVTFVGGTANAIGDHDGTGDPATLFTVTGAVSVRVYGVASVAPVGDTATIEVGVAGDTAGLIAQSTATDLAIGDVWLDATPTTKVEAISGLAEKIIGDGLDIILTVGTANITAGVVTFYCLWTPISEGAEVA